MYAHRITTFSSFLTVPTTNGLLRNYTLTSSLALNRSAFAARRRSSPTNNANTLLARPSHPKHIPPRQRQDIHLVRQRRHLRHPSATAPMSSSPLVRRLVVPPVCLIGSADRDCGSWGGGGRAESSMLLCGGAVGLARRDAPSGPWSRLWGRGGRVEVAWSRVVQGLGWLWKRGRRSFLVL